MGHLQIRFFIKEVKQRKSTHYEILHVGGEDHRILLNFLFLYCMLVSLFVDRNMCITGGVPKSRTISLLYIGSEKGQISIENLDG